MVKLLTITELAKRLGVSHRFAREVAKRLGEVKIGLGKRSIVRIPEHKVDKWIALGGDPGLLGVRGHRKDKLDDDTSPAEGEVSKPKMGEEKKAYLRSLKKNKDRQKRRLGDIVPRTKPLAASPGTPRATSRPLGTSKHGPKPRQD